MLSFTWMLFLVGLHQCSAESDGLLIHVDNNGADSAKCLQGESSCLTVNYALTKLQDKERDQPPVEIMVSSSVQKFPCQGIYDFNFTSLSITGEGDVTFRGIFGLTFEPDLKNVFVQVKGIKFENCKPTGPDSDPFNPGVVFAFIDTLIFEDCIVHYGSTLIVRSQNVTVDGCIFSEFNSSTLPVITSWVSFPGSRFKKSNWPSKSWTKDKSNIGSLVVRNSIVSDNTGTYTGPSDDYPGPGYILVDISGLPIEQYFEITHYDILISNCNFTNNKFIGRTTPFLFSNYGENFTANFTLENSNFANNSIVLKKDDYGIDVFPLCSFAMNTNTSFAFTVNQCSFLDYYFPPSALLRSIDSVDVELNIFESNFKSSHFSGGLHVIQDLSGNSANHITTNLKRNKYV